MTLTTLLLVDLSVLLVSVLPAWGYRDGGTWYSLDIFEIAVLGAGILMLLILMKAPYRLRGRIQRNTITENASES